VTDDLAGDLLHLPDEPAGVEERSSLVTDDLADDLAEHLIPLLQRLREGDRAAADELIRRAGLRLHHLAHQMLARFPTVDGRVRTDELVQSACERLLRALREVNPTNTTDFFGLAGLQIRRELIDLARAFRRSPVQLPDSYPEPADPCAGEDSLVALELWAAFNEAIDRLPVEERQVVDLRFYQDLTWPEIADVLRADESTGRRRWSRACLKLRRALGGWMPGEDGTA
jgi:RNA polymerase sigma-70 factor (ECF subfamily)